MTRSLVVSQSIVVTLSIGLLSSLVGCGGGVTQSSGADEVSLFAATADANASLVQTCLTLGQSCQLNGRGCQATQLFCGSGTEAGICGALSLGCGQHPEACAVLAAHCDGGAAPPPAGDPDKPGAVPTPGDPAPADGQCPKGPCDAPAPGETPSGTPDKGSTPPQQPGDDASVPPEKGPGTDPVTIDPATCCPSIDPCIASGGSSCAAMEQACNYDLSNIAPADVAAKATALKAAYCQP